MSEKIARIILLPIGLLLELFYIANDGARDLMNRIKFRTGMIGRNVCFTSDSKITTRTCIRSNSLINHSSIGKYSYVSENSMIQNATIGNYCSIGPRVQVGLGRHPLNLLSTSPVLYSRVNPFNEVYVDKNVDFEEFLPVEIGNDVWIGANAIILDGIKIGNGAVIAAGAVVTKDVAAYDIVGGVPAKVIGHRDGLGMINWWNMDPVSILKKKEQ